MSVHKTPKSEEDLILQDKLDTLRTLARLKARKNVRRELNELESAVVEAHAKELQSGHVTGYDIDLSALLRPQLPEASQD